MYKYKQKRAMWHKISEYNTEFTNITANSNKHQHATIPTDTGELKCHASTVGDVTSEDIVLTEPDDGLAYLTQMPSGDLMKFSQQSAIERIERDCLYSQDISEVGTVEVKQTLNVLPTIEEHDIGGYKFQVNLPTKRQRKGKSNWIFSEKLNKIYIRMNESFNLDATFTPKIPQPPLRLRMLLCFVKEVGEPVLRCQNHISKENELDQAKRASLVRCENPDAEYCGSAVGRSILDRYSVVVPLNMSITPGADNTIKQTIALKFACQNSCIGRRETSLIFLLESMNGEILSQRVLDVKICSCPKRDRDIDERNNGSTKRKMFEDSYPVDRKVPRQCSSSPSQVKDELSCSDLEEDSNDGNSKPRCDLTHTASGGCRLVVDLDNVHTAVRMLGAACESLAKTIVLFPNNHCAKREFKRLHRLYQKVHKS